eukprot:jgi/Chrzof1/15218/Cz09g31300.t1
MDTQRCSALTYAVAAQGLQPVGHCHRHQHQQQQQVPGDRIMSCSSQQLQHLQQGEAATASSSSSLPVPKFNTPSAGSEAAMNGSYVLAIAGSSGSSCLQPPSPHPRHAGIITTLCSYGALELHPDTINTPYPGLAHRSQLHINVRRADPGTLELLLANGGDVAARVVMVTHPSCIGQSLRMRG